MITAPCLLKEEAPSSISQIIAPPAPVESQHFFNNLSVATEKPRGRRYGRPLPRRGMKEPKDGGTRLCASSIINSSGSSSSHNTEQIQQTVVESGTSNRLLGSYSMDRDQSVKDTLSLSGKPPDPEDAGKDEVEDLQSDVFGENYVDRVFYKPTLTSADTVVAPELPIEAMDEANATVCTDKEEGIKEEPPETSLKSTVVAGDMSNAANVVDSSEIGKDVAIGGNEGVGEVEVKTCKEKLRRRPNSRNNTVWYSEKKKGWVCILKGAHGTKIRYFSTKKYGEEGARLMALQFRLEEENTISNLAQTPIGSCSNEVNDLRSEAVKEKWNDLTQPHNDLPSAVAPITESSVTSSTAERRASIDSSPPVDRGDLEKYWKEQSKRFERIPRVSFVSTRFSWIAKCQHQGVMTTQSFPIAKYGFEEARLRAIAVAEQFYPKKTYQPASWKDSQESNEAKPFTAKQMDARQEDTAVHGASGSLEEAAGRISKPNLEPEEAVTPERKRQRSDSYHSFAEQRDSYRRKPKANTLYEVHPTSEESRPAFTHKYDTRRLHKSQALPINQQLSEDDFSSHNLSYECSRPRYAGDSDWCAAAPCSSSSPSMRYTHQEDVLFSAFGTNEKQNQATSVDMRPHSKQYNSFDATNGDNSRAVEEPHVMFLVKHIICRILTDFRLNCVPFLLPESNMFLQHKEMLESFLYNHQNYVIEQMKFSSIRCYLGAFRTCFDFQMLPNQLSAKQQMKILVNLFSIADAMELENAIRTEASAESDAEYKLANTAIVSPAFTSTAHQQQADASADTLENVVHNNEQLHEMQQPCSTTEDFAHRLPIFPVTSEENPI